MSGFGRRCVRVLLDGCAQVGMYVLGGTLHEFPELADATPPRDAPPPGGPERLVPDQPFTEQESLIARDLSSGRGRRRRSGR
ncbi:DUF6059 family protein [Actinomadura sp. 3N508]|uniref:DUF6059 family protein n=1 Tax=Actinomadura sp. 3N508 TaxID=3375153 RepID=UPI0037B7FFAE